MGYPKSIATDLEYQLNSSPPFAIAIAHKICHLLQSYGKTQFNGHIARLNKSS